MRYIIMFVAYDEGSGMFVRTCLAQCQELEDARIIANVLLDRRAYVDYSFCEIYDSQKHSTFMVMKEE